MAYSKTNRLIMRRVPTGGGYGLGGLSWSDVKGGVSSVLNFYDTSQQNKGRADQAQADLKAAQEAMRNPGGLDTTTLVIGGVAVAGILFFALRKKS